jgi:cysteine-rich repeat protein
VEECDDGGLEDGDGCSSKCKIETGYFWKRGDEKIADMWSEICGDRLKVGKEQWDDGNTDSEDGWNSECKIEKGWACSQGNSEISDTCVEVCGDGYNVGSEICDDGNKDDLDGWTSDCTIIEEGWYCSGGDSNNPDIWTTQCGDGLRAGKEQCDDGVAVDGQGCSSECIIEAGWHWEGGSPTQKDTWTEIWGDGKRFNFDSYYWDDGNDEDGDGCSSTCAVEDGWHWSGGIADSSDTWDPIWGDGRRIIGKEECDDNNEVSGDGWSSEWTFESGYYCKGGSITKPDIWSIQWGDGLRAGEEMWDDGNTKDGDGWSSRCTVENDWKCEGGSPTSADEWKNNFAEAKLPFVPISVPMPSAPAMANTTKVTVVATGGITVALSATKSSTTTSLWAMVNQLQLLMLLVLIEGYITSNTKEYLLGQKFVMVSFDIFKATSSDDELSFLGVEQTNPDLKDIGIEYISAFRNILSILLIIATAIVLHIFFWFAARDEDATDLNLISRIYYWIRRKVLYILKYVFYLRLMLQWHEFFILSSMAEIKNFISNPSYDWETIISLWLAIIIFIECLLLSLLSFISYRKVMNQEKIPEEDLFGIFYSDLKNNKWAKLYTTNLLVRRTLFCIIVVAFLGENAVFIIFSFIFVIQTAYLLQFLVVRPFKSPKHNLIEIMNEVFILICISVFFVTGDSSEEEWRSSAASFVLISLVFNTVLLLIIETGKKN